MDRAFLSFVGWSFLPGTATRFVQSTYYGLRIRAGEPRPQPGTPRWVKHNQRIHAILVVAYLFLTVYDAHATIVREGDFYRVLGVSHDVTDRGIKSRFRRLAALHHPDKVSATSGDGISDSHFVHLKLAQDTLLNPLHRFAYDRFGPDMLRWEHCASIRDYLLVGFRVYAPSYTLTVLATLLLGVMGYLNWGRFWRYVSIASLILLEVYTVTRPQPPSFLVKIVNPLITIIPSQPPLLPFQMLALARKIAFTISVALSRLGPQFQSVGGQGSNVVDPVRLSRLEQLAMANEAEATRLLGMELAPHVGKDEAPKELKDGMREWLVLNTVRADPLIRQAIGSATERKKRAQEPA